MKEHASLLWLDEGNVMHAAVVAVLIDAVSPRPAAVHDPSAFRRERLALARKVICWCPWPERLGRWLTRAHRWFGVRNLGAYLRRACSKGEPDTVLESHSKNVLGRQAESWRDFTPETERALQGPRFNECQALTGDLAHAQGTEDPAERDRLRDDLKRYWTQQRPRAAREVLIRLVGHDRSDEAVARATEGILTRPQASWLLEAA